ncbi:MAG: PaaI family thioesterase [Polaromonas sp.]|nr:PaaI family thioesterase [Polaromonas sp.]
MHSIDYFNKFGTDCLPGLLGIVFTHAEPGKIVAELEVKPSVMAPNGFLHAGSIVTLADTACGYGCRGSLPEGASGFTTIELKSNHLGTARDGTIIATATAIHLGKNTQVWDATVTHKTTGKTIALFRCTQMVLYPKAKA